MLVKSVLEGEPSPRELAEEAIAHFERAAELMGIDDSTLLENQRRTTMAFQEKRRQSFPDLRRWWPQET